MQPPLVIELNSAELRLALRPDLGGSVAGLWFGELPVLRSTEPAALAGPRQSAAFPMLPYANRIADRRFRFGGVDHELAPNFDGSPHTLHGCGWLAPWQVADYTADSAELVLAHAPDAHWPFAFEARQRFGLGARRLRLELELTNRDERAQPAGLGWHPYFPKRHHSRLNVDLTGRWEHDRSGLPTRWVPVSGVDGEVAHMDFDHAFEGFGGTARLRDERLRLRLASSMTRLQVFTPPLRDYWCVEPVSHVPNAIGMADPQALGLKVLAPGEALSAWIELQVDPA